MNTPSPLLMVLALVVLGIPGAAAAVSLDGLVANSPFMPPQEQAAAPVVTENASVEFRGMIATRDGVLFGLYDRTRNVGAWVREREKSAEFQVQSYDASSDLVTVDYQGRKFTLPLSTSRIATAAASAVPRPAPVPGAAAPVAVNAAPADAARLESVAAEVRRRRALRQAAATGTPAPAAPAAGASQ